MTFWFSSDHHFGHSNIIGFSDRPYMSALEMDEALISEWNGVVRPSDHVYYLGDFSFHSIERTNRIIARLAGRKFLVKGNHDRRKLVKKMEGWEWIKDYHELEVGHELFVLMHYPLESWNRMRHGSIHLHGHSHGTRPPRFNRHDVGVDCNDYRPISLEEARERAKSGPRTASIMRALDEADT